MGRTVKIGLIQVQQDKALGYDGLCDQRSRNGDPLLLPAGQLVRLAVAEALQINLFQDFVDFRIGCFAVLQLQRKGNIGADAELVEHIIFLKNKSHICVAVGIKMLLPEALGRNALDEDFTAVITVEPAEDVQQG